MHVRKVAMWSVVVVLALAGVLYALLLLGVWAMQDRLMFGRRTATVLDTPASRNWPCEEVWAGVAGNKTYGWWLPVKDARGVVMFSHGNGRNIGGYLDDVAFFRDLGFSVLLYDYGGYGRSEGNPSEARCCADARAMWDYLVKTRGIPPGQIVLVGSSMGGGVTADLATHVAPAAIILESTFTSVPDAVADAYPFIPARWISHIQYRNIDKVGGIRCPVLVIHSKDDTVVPFEHGRRLFERITAPKSFVEIRGAHRGGKFTSRETYTEGLKRFLETYIGGTKEANPPLAP